MITKEFEKGRTNAKKEIKNENPFKIFENEKFGKIEVLFKDEQFYFPAIEIAEILGYKKPRDAVKRHCVNEFPYVVFHDVGINTGLAVQTIQKKYINEGNLYRLIAKSKLPEAREFERWIFDTVIPSIRKNGYYWLFEAIGFQHNIGKYGNIIRMCPTFPLKVYSHQVL